MERKYPFESREERMALNDAAVVATVYYPDLIGFHLKEGNRTMAGLVQDALLHIFEIKPHLIENDWTAATAHNDTITLERAQKAEREQYAKPWVIFNNRSGTWLQNFQYPGAWTHELERAMKFDSRDSAQDTAIMRHMPDDLVLIPHCEAEGYVQDWLLDKNGEECA